jgi:hypothetical protein
MNYAIISNGIVLNIVEATAAFAQEQDWIEATGAIIGGTWDGTTFAANAPLPLVIPHSVSMSQARSILILTDSLTPVLDALNTMTGTEGKLARSEFEFSQTVDRYRPLTLQMQAVLNLTDIQMDELFIRASKL